MYDGNHGRPRREVSEETLLSRITADPAIFGGKPIIRGRRLAVEHVLGMLTAGDSPETILSDYTWLDPDDVRACLVYDRLRGGPRTRRASAFQPRCKGRPQALVSAALDSMAALEATLKTTCRSSGQPPIRQSIDQAVRCRRRLPASETGNDKYGTCRRVRSRKTGDRDARARDARLPERLCPVRTPCPDSRT
jgi:uncharacterized protein (DUF433 family)